ncbi:NADH dehydrogenase (ubiquinone) iron-sulfur protein 1 [Cucumis melo var. makuwa]|uniref:NADH dehydrogenase [ubiquinone] iron-sulfur protein 1, mitochondrial isoform X2 n=2 Tax=Cucumis melo TaxID=3656 RepID=A0ABM3KXK5_CUCME|nr:NADH dehydrogenase [ubiquinone] iron-sulfur protein 1, mitochondrial isoform X2 [Cucumis melo]KAA0047391.1 NADH dehydrogenase (ubiquinone) iron-sulfur protein 1 [Cucumis melo var. makuwa]TYK14068.1 NADH dehydrogenase (ubiquinone) iron-sulfur protein 1 [Cucumis melo var. makuwa]
MGLGTLASRVVKPSSRLLTSRNPRNLLHFRPIFSTTELHNADASAAAQPQADPAPPPPPPRTPLAGARVHFSSPEDAIEVFVDGYPVKVPKGMTVLQACEIAGVDIPRFCYHSRLSIAGNCRMCLVEVEKSPKPVASCAMPALPGMKIKTDTPLAKKAREGVMEFLLMNHPLDCPICDQGGECDLQDQSMAFGSDRGRFTDVKRSVVDKNLGPLVKTVMTRCIQCTRCVRFATEVAGVQDLGMLGRGSGEEIGTYVEKLMTSELSGNVIDICPVGALTSKPFAFKARNWELKGTETIDVTDAVGSNIRIDSRGPEVMRIVPRLNEDINEEWISDKTRFCYDGLKRQRLNDPMIRGADGRFKAVSWRDALALVAEAAHHVKPEEIVGIAGKLSDAESMIALKDLLNRLGSNNVWCEGNGPQPNADLRSGYIMNTGIAGLEKADVFLLIGSQPKVEAAMINARIRKTVRATQAKVGYVGPPTEFNYDHQHLGTGPQTLVDIVEGRHPFGSILKNAKNPAIIVGAGLFERNDKDAIFSVVENIAKQNNVVRPDWNGYNVLLLNASQAAALDLGLVPESVTSIESAKFVYLMGADDVELEKVPKDAFVVYQGHHGDRGVYRANVILPAAAFSEKDGTYENTEGCAQQTLPAVPTVGDARDDWKIIRALSEVAGLQLPYDSLGAIRSRMKNVAPNLLQVDEREEATFSASIKPESTQKMDMADFGSPIENFYMTDSITRASKIMAQCSALLSKK